RENLVERRPLGRTVHLAKCMQINGSCFGGIFHEQFFNCRRDFSLRQFRWQFVHGAVLRVLDLKCIEKIAEHFFVRAKQPGLQDMARQRLADLASKRRLHPWEAFRRRFSFDKNAAEISLVRQTLNCRFVNRLLFRLQKRENLCREGGRHVLKNFVRFHRSAETMTVSASSSTWPYNFATDNAGGASASIFPAKRFVM